MPEMTPATWEFLDRYSNEVFGDQDEHLAGLMEEAVEAGLPPIAVSSDVGRLLKILTQLTRGRLAIEVGTLAGYSAIWIARGLGENGRLVTIEYNSEHAAFARRQFEKAGVSDRVELRQGAALDVLTDLAGELAPESVDLVFIDATKGEYVAYYEIVKPLVAPGGLIVADNVYAVTQGWIDQGYGTDEFNRTIAADPDFETVAVPLREGILIARRTS